MAEQDKGFTVRDRRFFHESSEETSKADAEKPEAETAKPEDADEAVQRNETGAGSGPEAGEYESPLPQINFSTFVFSLNSSALVHLGVIEDPGTGKKVKNLPLAKQTIDILGMLEEKTRGNLSKDEDNLLKSMLHDLRLMYVREKR